MNVDRALPELRGGIRVPVLGYALEFARNPVALIERGRQRYGDVFAMQLTGKRVMVLTGPAANEAFFRAPDSQLTQREVYRFMVPVFGPGVAYDCEPQVMEEQLGFLMPAMRDESMRKFATIMEHETEEFSDSWGDAGVLDLPEKMNELTTYIATRCLVGQEVRERLTGDFALLYKHLEGGINIVAFVNPRIPIPAHIRRDRARVKVIEIISRVIEARRARGIVGDDFLQALMQARYQSGAALKDAEIAGILLALIFAGQHTSAVLATWAGVLLFKHPHFLTGVMREQEDVMAGSPPISLDKIRAFDILSRAIMEAERMHPPLVVLMRGIASEFTYKDYVGRPGDLALVSPAVSHRIPEVFANPDRYDPDRFLPPREEHKKGAYALCTFGGGRHRCIGTAFAQLQVKTIWSVLLRRFEFELVTQDTRPNYSNFVVGPRQPCLVRYRRRRTAAASVPAVVAQA
jgi:sterol 14alpha-demethylase